MLANLADSLSTLIQQSRVYMLPWLWAFAGLWGINLLNWATGSKLNKILGLYPRHASGLLGIIASPILHQDFGHLLFNSIPLFVLGLVILSRNVQMFFQVTSMVVLMGGWAVWLFGRRALHIGASGLVSGYFGYIVATAYFDLNILSVLLAALMVYYFGSIFFGIFPQEEKISWESHLFGFLSGIASAYMFR